MKRRFFGKGFTPTLTLASLRKVFRRKTMPKLVRGFTIFFAVLVASLSLSIGLAIYDLFVRELLLSQTATQSQYAIYAADTGIECALYWDIRFASLVPSDADGSAFATSSDWNRGGTADGLNTVTCNTQAIPLTSSVLTSLQPTGWVIAPNGTTATTTFPAWTTNNQ